MNSIPFIDGQIDWVAYHAQRAIEFRDVASGWREAARGLAETDPQFAVFAVARANANDMFAEQAESEARGFKAA